MIEHYKVCPKCNGSGKILDSGLVGETLREQRKSARLSLRLVAGRMNISAPYLNDLELGRRNWSEVLIKSFRNALK